MLSHPPIAVLPPTALPSQVLMTQDGATVVTMSKDCTVRVWDTATGDCRHVLTGAPSLLAGVCGRAGRAGEGSCACCGVYLSAPLSCWHPTTPRQTLPSLTRPWAGMPSPPTDPPTCRPSRLCAWWLHL